MQPYDMEMGAGTFHTATYIRSIGPEPWAAAYVQPSRRPTDGRYGENPNRLQHYYQFQVIIKPSPPDLQALYLGSLEAIDAAEAERMASLLRTSVRSAQRFQAALPQPRGSGVEKRRRDPRIILALEEAEEADALLHRLVALVDLGGGGSTTRAGGAPSSTRRWARRARSTPTSTRTWRRC